MITGCSWWWSGYPPQWEEVCWFWKGWW